MVEGVRGIMEMEGPPGMPGTPGLLADRAPPTAADDGDAALMPDDALGPRGSTAGLSGGGGG